MTVDTPKNVNVIEQETLDTVAARDLHVELWSPVGRMIMWRYIRNARRLSLTIESLSTAPDIAHRNAEKIRLRAALAAKLLDAADTMDDYLDRRETWRMVPISGTVFGRHIAVNVIRDYIQSLGENPTARDVARLNEAIRQIQQG